MKVVVLCDKDDVDLARSVLSLLRTLNIKAEAFSMGAKWRTDQYRFDEILSPFSHFVVLYSPRSVAAAWLSFAAGYAAGASRPLVLFRNGGTLRQAQYLAAFFMVLSLGDLASFFETERQEWVSQEERRRARQELLEMGISFRGETFAEAVREGNLHASELFLKAGLPADNKDRKGVPLLSIAAREGNRAMVDFLIDAGAPVNLQAEDRQNTALMDAVSLGNAGIVEDLIGAGTDLNIKSKDDQTALILAVGKNDVRIASMLLAAGANPDLPDKLGFSARKYAKLFHNSEMVDLMGPLPEA